MAWSVEVTTVNKKGRRVSRVSYTRADHAEAIKLREILVDAGISTWPGDKLKVKIKELS